MVSKEVVNEIAKAMTEKFQSVLEAQIEHSRKTSKENQLLRSKITALLKQSKTDAGTCGRTSEPIPERVEGDSIWVGSVDLMTIRPDGGPSKFGRAVAAAAFGANEKCHLINHRIGARFSKSGARSPCDPELESKFSKCIARNFSNDVDETSAKAISGANQYGSEMRAKYPHLIVSNENVQS